MYNIYYIYKDGKEVYRTYDLYDAKARAKKLNGNITIIDLFNHKY